MVTSIKTHVFIVFSLFVIVLAGCASTGTSDITEKTITDIRVLEGKWKGFLTNGPSNVLTVKANGSWTNKVKGKTFVGTASIKEDKIHVESLTTGIAYYWRLYESDKHRILKWIDIGSGKVIATDKFSPGK